MSAIRSRCTITRLTIVVIAPETIKTIGIMIANRPGWERKSSRLIYHPTLQRLCLTTLRATSVAQCAGRLIGSIPDLRKFLKSCVAGPPKSGRSEARVAQTATVAHSARCYSATLRGGLASHKQFDVRETGQHSPQLKARVSASALNAQDVVGGPIQMHWSRCLNAETAQVTFQALDVVTPANFDPAGASTELPSWRRGKHAESQSNRREVRFADSYHSGKFYADPDCRNTQFCAIRQPTSNE